MTEIKDSMINDTSTKYAGLSGFQNNRGTSNTFLCDGFGNGI